MSDKERHESWGIIALSHTQSSSTRLFRSPTMAHGMVSLRIAHASLPTTAHGEKRPWPEEQIVEVFMSPVQFAGLIASVKQRVADGKPLSVTALRDLLRDLETAHVRATTDLDHWRRELAGRARVTRAKVVADLHATADLIVRGMGLEALREKAWRMLPTFGTDRVIDVEEDRE